MLASPFARYRPVRVFPLLQALFTFIPELLFFFYLCMLCFRILCDKESRQ